MAFVISSYSNIKRITKHVEDIAAAFGDPIAGGPFGLESAFAFPGPAVLAEVSEQEFRRMGLGWRAKFLTRTARAALDLPHGLLALRGAPYDEAKDALLGFYGVGEKVADCVLAFSLDQPRAFPVDVWVRRAVREWYFAGESLTDRRVREWAAGYFGDHAAYAQQYLFHRPAAGDRVREGTFLSLRQRALATQALQTKAMPQHWSGLTTWLHADSGAPSVQARCTALPQMRQLESRRSSVGSPQMRQGSPRSRGGRSWGLAIGLVCGCVTTSPLPGVSHRRGRR